MRPQILICATFLCYTGCLQHEIFDRDQSSARNISEDLCKGPAQRHIVFLVSSQGSRPGPGGSQFTDYVMYGKYQGRADFTNEPLMSSGTIPPTHERLQQIANDIAAAMGHDEHHVDVWAFSMGANSMYRISGMVKAQTGSIKKMHVLLIDPMVLDNFVGGHTLVDIFAFFGMPFAKMMREDTAYILHNPGYINLSGGSVINIDVSLRDPLVNFVKFINGDRHYPWKGRSKLQRKILHYLDGRFEAVLRENYD